MPFALLRHTDVVRQQERVLSHVELVRVDSPREARGAAVKRVALGGLLLAGAYFIGHQAARPANLGSLSRRSCGARRRAFEDLKTELKVCRRMPGRANDACDDLAVRLNDSRIAKNRTCRRT